ncbi:MAG TPA: hypothetical protein VFZ48_05425 [Candidatus Saccharimonadales bacterium]
MGGNAPRGEFGGSALTTTVGQLKVGEFGYIDPSELAVRGEEVFLDPDVIVTRRAPGETIRVERVAAGYRIRFVGFTEHHWARKEPSADAVKVVRISVGGANHVRWSRLLAETTVATMANELRYVARAQVEGSPERPEVRAEVVVFKLPKAGRVALRRRSGDKYSIELDSGWCPLTVIVD